LASQLLSFNCVKDTYINADNQGANYGSSTTLRVGQIYSSVPTSTFASFIGFDLSSIPKNKVITKMTLKYLVMSFFIYVGPVTMEQYMYSDTPVVVKARRVNEFNLAELESLLTYTSVKNSSEMNNVIEASNSEFDSSYNITLSAGSIISMPILDVAKSENGECIIALFRDENYRNSVSNICSANIGSREYFAPILEVTIDDYIPTPPTELQPNNTIRNKAGEINLSWQFKDILMDTMQASYSLMYSKDSFTTSTTVNGTTNSFYLIPANAFTLGNTVQWKVRVTDTNGDTSAWSNIASFTIGATVPSIPDAISPTNTIVNSSDEVYFRWKYIDLFGYQQAKYDFQFKKATDIETTVTNISESMQYIMPKLIMLGGDYSWRVRTYNAFGEASPYTEWKTFFSIGKPDTPIINSVSNSMNPLIKWTSNAQDLFIIKIYQNNTLIHDSGEQASKSVNEYIIDEYLNDGNYTVGVQISNIYGFWSTEVISTFVILTEKPTKPKISVGKNEFYLALIIESQTISNLIYRKGERDNDFKLITSLTANNYLDYSATVGLNQYFVRALSTNAFNDSDIVTASLSFCGITLAGEDNKSDMIHLYLTKDTDKRKSILLAKTQSKLYCNGRIYPIIQSLNFKNHSEGHEYFIEEIDYDTFYRIANYNTLLYRNNYGYSYIVEMSNISIVEDIFGYILVFTLTRLEE